MSQEELNQKLFDAVDRGNIKDIQSAIKNGADINARNKESWTALMQAAWNGCLTIDMLEVFLRHGTDVNVRNKYGWTALMQAAWNGCLTIDMLKVFIHNGADINVRDTYDRRTALMWAAYAGHLTVDMLEVFLRHGTDVNARDKKGNTALMLAAWDGCLTIDMLEVFLRNGAYVNTKNEEGYTALTQAAWNGCLTVDMLEVLLDKGAEINITNKAPTNFIQNLLSCVNNSNPDIQEKFLLAMFTGEFSTQPLSPEFIKNIGLLLCSYLSFLGEAGEDATEKLALVVKFLKKNCEQMTEKGTPETKKYLNQATAQIGILIKHLDTEVTFNVNEMVI